MGRLAGVLAEFVKLLATGSKMAYDASPAEWLHAMKVLIRRRGSRKFYRTFEAYVDLISVLDGRLS